MKDKTAHAVFWGGKDKKKNTYTHVDKTWKNIYFCSMDRNKS